ncbi:CBN-FOZI-1 protein [Caenorhabditis brenneri]|uniref:CBN-FOZI-1 protein n=1 Tax=Caenorhabditis brenneri TaxID=135651 RepID=G0MJY7_CAEBE|nr:CBN-FOZI-1 protein [Caenorhabditis brenneri]
MMLASSAPAAPSLLPPNTQPSSATNRTDECSSSTSPTNTSASDASMEMLTNLMNGAVAAAAVPGNSLVKQESPPLNTSPLFNPDLALLQFSQLFQAQQAMVQFHNQQKQQQQIIQQQAQQQAQQAQQQQNQQNQQNNQSQNQSNNNNNNNNNNGSNQSTTSSDRKRSYPCTFQYCVICQKDVHSSKLPCHIRQCHVAKPMFQCPACDFTSTYSKNNVKSHMVSLHGLAGDPISYMDKYAGQVEEFMKLCFPNVRGRGRPMQGRTSPKSPTSPTGLPGRRGSQASSLPTRRNTVSNDLLATIQQQQQQQVAFHHLRNLRFNPLQSIFPSVLANNNNNNSILAANKHVNNFLIKQEEKDVPAVTMPMEDIKNIITPSTTSPCPSVTSSVQIQPIKPGENAQPKYLNNTMDWPVLNELQIKGTIFTDCRQNMELYTENIARKIETTEDFSSFSLSDDMRVTVEEVRSKVSVQLFEVMFAIHRMDIKVLDLNLVNLLLQIAPTNSDAQLLRKMENLSDPNEEFLLGLTKIDHIEEKLETMKHMHMLPEQIEILKEKLLKLEFAVKVLVEGRALRNVLQLVLAILNLAFFDDRQCLSINGFSVSDIMSILETKTPSGQSIQSILVTILKDEINLDLDELFSIIDVLEKIEHEDFNSIGEQLMILDDRTVRAEREMEHSGSNIPLSEFVDNAKLVSRATWESFNSLKTNIQKLTAYLGNPIPRHQNLDSYEPFQTVLHLLRSLKTAIELDDTVEEQHINVLSP